MRGTAVRLLTNSGFIIAFKCHRVVMKRLLPLELPVRPQLLEWVYIWLGRGHCEVCVARMTAKWAAPPTTPS